jgi:non-specific serine/threonine protein kinase/serine/threonine-protein kinase
MSEDQRPPDDLESTRTAEPSDLGPPARIGDYRILQKLGEGGMGEVYEAEQERPVRRKVALKLIKLGMDSKQVVARFESERQALALMSHPSIAKVFDAGVTEQGRPYFALEHVKGEPITVYCDKHRLSTAERLQLFVQICDGVQHAHQKGIIHRDLKPSNVLVELADGKPVPKIIDFGVAKATQHRLIEQTIFTQLGVLVGTPAYMSPEQAEMTGLDVDTRTDVYSLGVMLYELLVGALPVDPQELKAAGYDEIRRKIREEEPSRPSTRITSPGTDSTETAKRRSVDLHTLRRQLRGDLDWITMKALAKDRTRRYGSPNELAADIGRHLRHEPVEAGPPSAAYRVRKFVRRNRVGVVAGAVALVALIGGLAGAVHGLVRATRAEAQARQEAATAEQVSEFLVGLFEVSNPSEARGNEITAREILDQGAERISRELQDQPLVRGRLLHTMGQVYRSLALIDQARPRLEESLEVRRSLLGDDDPAVADSLMALGELCFSAGEYQTARTHFEEALRIRESRLGPHDLAIAESVNSLARTLSVAGRVSELPPLLKRVLDINDKSLDTDHSGERSSMAWIPHHRIALEDSRALLERDLAIRERALGPDHPTVWTSLISLGLHRVDAGELEAGRSLLERAHGSRQRFYGNDHPETAASRFLLASVLTQMGKLDAALPMMRRNLEYAEATYGPDNRMTAEALLPLGSALMARGDDAEAISHLERAVQILEETEGHAAQQAQALSGLGSALARQGELERARQLLERAVATSEQAYGSEHLLTEQNLYILASVMLRSGDPEGAIPLLERCLAVCREAYGPDSPQVAQRTSALADARALTGDHEGARLAYEDAIATLEATVGPDNVTLVQPLFGLARLHALRGNTDQGRALFERSDSILETTLGKDHPLVFYNRACFHALAGDRDEAIRSLRDALDLGYLDSTLIEDPDLASLHGDPEFEALLAELHERFGEP